MFLPNAMAMGWKPRPLRGRLASYGELTVEAAALQSSSLLLLDWQANRVINKIYALLLSTEDSSNEDSSTEDSSSWPSSYIFSITMSKR